MKSSNPFQSKFAQTLAAALILASTGIASAQAADATTAPSKAMCEQQAKAQGLSGKKEKAFVEQCLHGS